MTNEDAYKGPEAGLCFLVMICEAEFAKRVIDLLDDMKISGFTSFTDVDGSGRSGRREDSDVWPGRNTIIFVALESDEQAEQVVAGAEDIIQRHYRKRPGFKAFRMHGDALN